MVKIRFVIPKGSLENETYRILDNAGYVLTGQDRTYRPSVNDPEIDLKIMRPQEIPYLVADGTHDLGITGEDWVEETGAEVVPLLLLYLRSGQPSIPSRTCWRSSGQKARTCESRQST